MSDDTLSAQGRAEFHRQFESQAQAHAERLLAQRVVMGSAWLSWVAGQLYEITPAPLAAMVRRELQRLNR
ncbi:hypothetical protein [Pseudomonas sp. EZ-C24]|uniref:hypothetical protein n=1 Tax=Pseudomonas sp. EZ-C24 TaxID=2753617 RepID=UPI00165EB24A|nr:hypothetical protein [Pseudomonas sp. EZ-C24]